MEYNIFVLIFVNVDVIDFNIFILGLYIYLNRKDIDSLIFNFRELEIYKEIFRFEDIRRKYS